MDLSFRFDRWFDRLPASPRDAGTVERVVVRPGPGERETPDAIRVSPAAGVEGDWWPNDPDGSAETQVSFINVHVIHSLAGEARRAPLSGDNVHVDLDLSEANLPVGTRLRIGSAVFEVSDAVHRPCAKFVERFGPIAAKRVARATRIGLRGRGVLCRVAQAGEVRVHDRIVVERPASPPDA
ncbi:MAG: MOSC domain-containing protein [bacterium]|nr:MOSC domain-containing protein [bacterium]